MSGRQVLPNPFTPNGDTITDTTDLFFTPAASADSVVTVEVLVIRESDQAVVTTLITSADFPSGVEVRRTWDPGPIADGDYRFDIAVTEGAASDTVSVGVTADSTPPVVTIGTVVPNPFNPNASAGADTLRIPVTVTSDSITTVSTSIKILRNAVEQGSIGPFSGTGAHVFLWDGTLGAGNATSGPYDLVAETRDLAGNLGTDTRVVTVDISPPSVLTDLPDTVQTTMLPITLKGTATDNNVVLRVDARRDGGPTYAPVDSMSAPGSLVTWQVVFDDPTLTPAYHDIRVRATDAVGLVDSLLLVVAYDFVAPVPVSAPVAEPDTVGSGDLIQIRTVWNVPGLTVTGDFGDLDSGYLVGAQGQRPETVIDEGDGTYLVDYVISDANSRVPGLRRVVVRASTGVLFAQDTVFVDLKQRFVEQGDLVSINRNHFDPQSGDEVTIAARFATIALDVKIYDLAGRRVRRLGAQGSVAWDGRDEDRQIVSSGIYFLQVQAGDDQEIRKVAVTRGRPSP